MHCYTHLNTRSCGGDTTCHTEMNDHSSRMRLGTAADRKVPFSTRSQKITWPFSSLMLSPAPASPAPFGPVRRPWAGPCVQREGESLAAQPESEERAK